MYNSLFEVQCKLSISMYACIIPFVCNLCNPLIDIVKRLEPDFNWVKRYRSALYYYHYYMLKPNTER